MSFSTMEEGAPLENSFQDFSMLPKRGHVTVCEVNTQLQTYKSSDPNNPADASSYTHITGKYFPINANCLKPFLPRKIPSIRTDDHDESFLLAVEQGYVKAIWDGWNDNGLMGIIQGLRKSGGPPLVINILTSTLNFWRNFKNMNRNIGTFFFPHLELSTEDLIERFAPIRNWRKSWIRAIAWHPNVPILALALKDDSIRVFCTNSDQISLLKTAEQKFVSSLSWRPCTDELAVGTVNGILIWEVDYTVKPGSAKSRFLSVSGHSPVTSVDYSSSGYWLLSASSADTSMIVWDANSGNYTALHRFGGGGVPRASWSPNCATKIFSTSPTSVFRLWVQDNEFKPKRWTTPSKHVEAFCWSPCGTIILFVSDSTLYSINLNPSQIEFVDNFTDPIAVPVFDLKVCFVSQIESELLFKVGGEVLQIEWDETGKRLAIFFSDSDLIALFRVEINSTNFIFPCGFIRGHDGEYPMAIAFQKGFVAGALLTIAWSTQRIQYFPMIFAENGIGNYAFQQESRRFDRPQQKFVGPPVVDFPGFGLRPTENTPGPDASRKSASFKLFSP